MKGGQKMAMSSEEGLSKLVDDWGFVDEFQMLEVAGFGGTCPAICLECGYSTEMEPDQDRGWCEECEANTVKSCLILATIL